ncbi:cellulase family glycosylhydrolase [Aureibaculum sp. 2210JD6-5]|uniref:cellulase family glycosylhydrolase n=1 Tax=Aureibaculum sp. 2210JD6-5 TaxID=3103957 RepID=UPI002AACBD51|nr:cellulase family glycosylhydrolase [Aureibaculum sp. 2210JD6-5]MDY7396789.1 cellulase family glycosylhydrolase [Aureibaculum sp. 2210JD6-5]
MKKIITFIIYCIIICPESNAQFSPDEMVKKMGRGINLGNTLSAPIEGNWQPAVKKSYFKDVADAGFTTVRIPIDFFGNRTSGNTTGYSKSANTSSSYNGSANDYIVSSDYLDRIEQVISWSLDENLITILDFHGNTLKDEFLYTFSPKSKWSAYYTDPTSAKRKADNEKFRAIWAAIANRFKSYSHNLVFEIINEPYFFMTNTEMDVLNNDIISIIRNSGANNTNRNIIITGGSKNAHEAPLQIGKSVLDNDNNLIATFHYYKPRAFTSSSDADNNDYNWGTEADKAIIDNNFNMVKTWSTQNNIPILFGEFGADNEGGYNYHKKTYGTNGGPEKASRVAYYGYLSQKAIDLGFAFTAWDAGDKSNKTIYKVTDRTWVTDVKNALLGKTLSISSLEGLKNELIVYPNPAENQIFITSEKKISSLKLYDSKGSEKNIIFMDNFINLSHFSRGIYILKVNFENGNFLTEKIIVKN